MIMHNKKTIQLNVHSEYLRKKNNNNGESFTEEAENQDFENDRE
jgi:hypothetical protein